MFERIKDWIWNRSAGYELRKAGVKFEYRKGPSFAQAIEKLIAEEAAQHGVEPDASPRAPECNHVWLHNMKMGWKICSRCGERRSR